MNEQNEIPAENTLMPPQPEIPAPAGQLVYTQAAMPRTYTPHTATKWDTLPHDAVFACLSCLLGFLMMRYVIVMADGIVTTLCFLLLYGFSALYIRKSGCKPKPVHRLLGAVICIFSLSFSITASALVHGLTFLFLMPAIVWRTHAVCGGAGFVTRYFPLDLCASVIEKPFQHFTAGPQAVSDSMKKSAAATAVKTTVLGLLVTIPLTIVVGVLLASADSGIEKLFGQFGNMLTENAVQLILQLLFGIPCGIWLFAFLFSAAQRKRKPDPFPSDAVYAEKLNGLRFAPNLGLYAGVTPICLLYLVYVISQTNYFLSAFAGKLPEGMIYSEYARRGFFELCAIAVINLIVLLVLTGCAKKGGADRPKALTVYAVILCLFTLFIIATALAKMVLYISAYGMTPLRVYTTWFMVLLTMVFLVLLVRQFTAKLPTAAVLTGLFIVMLGGLCFSRPDARIAEYNIRRWEQGTLSELDVKTLCELSDDAYNVMAHYRELLVRADKWDYVVREGRSRVDNYREHKDLSWNYSAQLLIQQLTALPVDQRG
ncbi:MAG: DUF4173 domain-containing protein [Oscillospiraceae bacterium]|nr:DUF4173 domain-containing protein [Oscillospiraceae bacterium]